MKLRNMFLLGALACGVIGVVLPMLISSQSDLGVFFGFGVICAAGYIFCLKLDKINEEREKK